MDDATPDLGEDLGSLLIRARPGLRAVLARFRIPFEDAEDLVQDVLVQFWRKRGSIREPERWLPSALRLRCLMFLRSRRRSRVVAVDEAILEIIADPELAPQDREMLMAELARQIQALEWKCREILRRRYLDGQTNREVAAGMGYKVSSVDKTASRCLDKLCARFQSPERGIES